MTFYSRKNNRIPNYDYSTRNYYFITICTENRKCLFGHPEKLNTVGTAAKEHIMRLPSYYDGIVVDKYVVMPNHIHMIIQIQGDNQPTLSQVVGQYKTGVTKEIRKIYPGMKVWQRSFHDHIIRSQKSYEKIWLYIDANPDNWDKDKFYVNLEMISAL